MLRAAVARRTGRNGPVPFANDPYRGPPLSLDDDLIRPLSLDHRPTGRDDEHYLSTALIDYFIQRGMPTDLASHFLVGSTNAYSYFETLNRQNLEGKTAVSLRQKYQFYSFNEFRFVAANCSHKHFFVIDVTFDINRPKIFTNVVVYDSLRSSGRHNESVNRSSTGAKFLCQLQKFLAKFSFYDMPMNAVLLRDPEYILQGAISAPCPQQRNSYDCSLFALATVLHLAHGLPAHETAFGQEHINQFRAGLHDILMVPPDVVSEGLPDPRKLLTRTFLCSFFPNTRQRLSVNAQPDDDPFLSFIENRQKQQLQQENRHNQQPQQEIAEESHGRHKQQPQQEVAEESHGDSMTDQSIAITDESHGDSAADKSTVVERVLDKRFVEIFMGEEEKGDETLYESMAQIDSAIDKYEDRSGNRLIIRTSGTGTRTYICVTHFHCCFRAKFGKVRGGEQTILNRDKSNAYHCGPLIPPKEGKSRARKKRVKGRLEPVVDAIMMVKDDNPLPKDVRKAAANLGGMSTTYNQSYRVVASVAQKQLQQDKLSFQLIVPYLENFMKLNPESITRVEKDKNNAILRVFVCPGIMKTSMRYVRPIMSIDAAHLRSQWKGTMYVASVKTACDEIYPVALGVMRDNEQKQDWTWFLQLLHSSIGMLSMEHPVPRVGKKFFTFISDRQKGLINALEEVFPDNHSCFCAVHIARNTERHAGKKVANYVMQLSKTFSRHQAAEWLIKIGEFSPPGRQYLEEIIPSQWRSTAWLDDPSLPPRYGIVTTNMSESTNSMFENARDGSWLHTIDCVLRKMMLRIATLHEKHKGKEGAVDTVVGLLKKRWEECAAYRVLEVGTQGCLFSVLHENSGLSTQYANTAYTIDTLNKTCGCGKWQDHGVPCVHAMAYYRLLEEVSLDYVLQNLVDQHYTYEDEINLVRTNFVPVCIEHISHDGCTLPPAPSLKRTTGRPPNRRIRKRSRWAHDPEKSNVICSRCKKRGHNVRTCLAREETANSAESAASAHQGGGNRTNETRRVAEQVVLPELDLS